MSTQQKKAFEKLEKLYLEQGKYKRLLAILLENKEHRWDFKIFGSDVQIPKDIKPMIVDVVNSKVESISSEIDKFDIRVNK